MKQLILVRAGSTAWEEASVDDAEEKKSPDDRRLQGILPLPLSESGKVELRRIAELLKKTDATRVYSSGNESSGSTALFLTELCELKAKKTPALRELDFGLWQGLRIKEVKQRYASAYKQWRSDPFSICPPEGETLGLAWLRIEEALIQINKRNRQKVVAIVAAPFAGAILECLVTQRPKEELWAIIDQGGEYAEFDILGKSEYGIPLGRLIKRDLNETTVSTDK